MESVADSGGRVTRALRKRLTSVDCDSSSRPGTPVQNKGLAATNSPVTQRITRRNSTSGPGTPVKTPGKRATTAVPAILEADNQSTTPAKRTTRRRSLPHVENGSTPKLELKTPKFAPVPEEKRITRSASKSPTESEKVKLKDERPEAKRPLNENNTESLSVESSHNQDSEKSPKEDSPRRSISQVKQTLSFSPETPSDAKTTSIVLSDLAGVASEENVHTVEKTMDSFKSKTDIPEKSTKGGDVSKDMQPTIESSSCIVSEPNEEQNLSTDEDTVDRLENASNTKEIKVENLEDLTNTKTESDAIVSKQQNVMSDQNCKGIEFGENTCSTAASLDTQPHSVINDIDIVVDIITSPQRNDSTSEAVPKTVSFLKTSDDECKKSVYPKTPASVKSRSWIDANTSHNEEIAIQSEAESIIDLQTDDSDAKANDIEMTNEIECKNSEVESDSCRSIVSTTRQSVSPMIELKWCNPSVTSKGPKVDVVEDEIDTVGDPLKEEGTMQQNSIHIEDDASSIGDDESRASDDVVRSEFVDDEAMVVDNYESGDSMESEERQEMEDNEIPVDGESIGSHTSEEIGDCDEEETDIDSFIVSDNCEEPADQDSSDIGDKSSIGSTKKYKRIQKLTESSDDEDTLKSNSPTKSEIITNKNSLDCSALSDSERPLCADAVNISSKVSGDVEILRTLNQSEHFDKSVRGENDIFADEFLPQCSKNSSDVASKEELTTNLKTCDGDDPAPANNSINQFNAQSADTSDQRSPEIDFDNERDQCQSCHNDSSEGNKENENMQINERKVKSGLSVSFGNFKQKASEASQQEKRPLRRSFTIGVTLSDGELKTDCKKVSTNDSETESTSPASSVSSNRETDGGVLSSDDLRCLENVKHIPLGNPLARARRQSLALPANPDTEIYAGQHTSEIFRPNARKRKSLAVLMGNDFNPSQSFVESLKVRKAELEQQTQSSKRKRLSKSFSGTSSGGLDNSCTEIGLRHAHKRPKTTAGSSPTADRELIADTSSMCSKKIHSSTPHEKSFGNHNDSGFRRIQDRCNEILEAANRAKLESKMNYKKSKVRLSKKQKKGLHQKPSSDGKQKLELRETKHTVTAGSVVKEALKASADIITGKHKHKIQTQLLKCCLPLQKSSPIEEAKHKCQADENSVFKTHITPAGNVVETLQSPQRKGKATYIQLPTGIVCVEPITPKKRSVLACNGMAFRESPITPRAVGFKVRHESGDDDPAGGLRKRKRKFETIQKVFSSPQWTQSGPFLEEEIPSISSSFKVGAESKNFRQSALYRNDIKRSTPRELLQLRERRQRQERY